jgi:rod shape determining protein RodA
MTLILHNAHKARDPLGKLICVGVFGIIAFQTVCSVGMCLSVLPVIGVTLPLFSGGRNVCPCDIRGHRARAERHRHSYTACSTNAGKHTKGADNEYSCRSLRGFLKEG